VTNSGGIIDITWNIEYSTTPNYVYFKLEDPARTTTYDDQTYLGTTGITVDRQWTVPAGAPDGKYWIRVEYWSYEAGNEANAEVTFYVCTETASLTGVKNEDVDRDGGCIDDNSPIEDWWICLTTPLGDTYCSQTNSNGTVTWTNLPIGDYTIYEPPVAGWNPVFAPSRDVTLIAGISGFVGFCNVQTTNKGACCGPWGSSACMQAYEGWCTNQGGVWMGAGTDCGNEICSTKVEARTWGSIKAMYR
jgi:hypothetical protein